MSQFEVIEELLEGSTSELIPYTVDFTDVGVSTLDSATVAAYDELDESDVTSSVFPVPPTVTVESAVATLTLLQTLTKGHTYRIEILGKEGSAYKEGFFRVFCSK